MHNLLDAYTDYRLVGLKAQAGDGTKVALGEGAAASREGASVDEDHHGEAAAVTKTWNGDI